MGVTIHRGTMPGGVTPTCNECGVLLCWDISNAEYEEAKPFWDDWCCQDCNGGKAMSLHDWKAANANMPKPAAAAPAEEELSGWIDDPDDPELEAAWPVLKARVGDLSGWQYVGSRQAPGQAWQHTFRNRRLLESAEDEEEMEAAHQEVEASAGWEPQLRLEE